MAEFVRFPTTFWSTILQRPRDAREAVFVRYRTPIFNFICNRGFDANDADDLTQEVFLRVCREDFLRQADRDKGRFRNLLLAVTRNVILKEHERRARAKKLPAPPAESGDDPSFDMLWLQNLVTLAIERLQKEGPARQHEAFTLHKYRGLSYAEIGERMGATLSDARNWIHAAKVKVKAYLEEEIRRTCSTAREMEEEVAKLLRALR
jgi:RNA polymerase sigma-70 factor (ECF subfamily)